MLKHYLLYGILILVCCQSNIAVGQALTVKGVVRDETNTPLPGVNVVVKGTTGGTITDGDGRYTVNVPDGSAVLVFTFIGYADQEVNVGGQTNLDVSMAADITSLDEVVVTALGIEKSSKSLGYSTTKVNGDAIAINRTPNPMNALTGKIAGVSITALGTGPGGSSKIRIRGQSSISGQNNPLLVVNGIPIDNTNFGTNQGNNGSDTSIGNRGGGASFDGGDAFSSLNPDDIESMTVLKGSTASALYGSRAKDGVIMITTKTRGTGRGIGITYNLNYSNDTPLDFTDYQYEYGQGEYGIRPTTPNPQSGQWSFGEKIQPGMTQILFNNQTVPYEAQKGILKDFYRNGQNLTNTIAVSSNTDKGGFNLSVADARSNGITPNNSFNRQTVNLGITHDFTPKFHFKTNINYSKEENTNPPVIADQDNSMPTALFAMANTMPLSVLDENKYNAGGGEYLYSRFTNRTNPYWGLAEVKGNIRRDRILGNVTIKYDITDWLSVQGRLGLDFYTRASDYRNLPTGKASINGGSIYSSSAPAFYNGLYTQDNRSFRENNSDFLVTAIKDFGDFGININAGGNIMQRYADVASTQVTDFSVRNLYVVGYGRAKDPTYNLSERQVNSLYAAAEVNFREWLYLNVTARNDWFSTLSPANRSILYPSISASYVFSESFATKPSWLNSGRVRVAYAEVGSDTDVAPYSQQLIYSVNANQFQGQAVSSLPASVPNPNLKPMRTGETEIGLEMKMFNNRVNVDVAAYRKLTNDQIVQAQISDASGYVNTLINSGESENKGIELMVNLIPIETDNFSWDFTFAGAYNITKVMSLLNDTKGSNITVGTHVFNGWVQQIVGEEMGQIVGYGYRRWGHDPATNQPLDPETVAHPENIGKIMIGTNGIPLATTRPIPFGSALPRWTGGFTNSFTYKGISLSVLIDFKLGGKMLSGTNFNAYRHGLHKNTLVGRDNLTSDTGASDPGGYVLNTDGVDANGLPNTKAAKVEDYYSVVRGSGLVEPVIYNAGFWKLRQITIGYDFTKYLPENLFVKGVKLSVFSNNVAMLKKWVDNIDPESFGYTSDNVVGLESPGVPTTRSIGFNLNVKF
ncbi:SusC/RagA family TonB-linked outer membrane protein [Chryseolinea sp. T2]|uniref:SusC/RagA family TonB-linked outer membrane protein n=1 Tax=Chryseolinea sp. T2 TaxID=3129255 RepID=UPI0030788B58